MTTRAERESSALSTRIDCTLAAFVRDVAVTLKHRGTKVQYNRQTPWSLIAYPTISEIGEIKLVAYFSWDLRRPEVSRDTVEIRVEWERGEQKGTMHTEHTAGNLSVGFAAWLVLSALKDAVPELDLGQQSA